MIIQKTKKNWLYVAMGIFQVFIAVGALPAGWLYISDPSGASMGNTTAALANSPLSDYLIPGLCLFFIHGTGNLASSVFSFMKKKISPYLGVFFGSAQIIWIAAQVSWIGLISFLQPLLFVIGSMELILGIVIYLHQRKMKALA